MPTRNHRALDWRWWIVAWVAFAALVCASRSVCHCAVAPAQTAAGSLPKGPCVAPKIAGFKISAKEWGAYRNCWMKSSSVPWLYDEANLIPYAESELTPCHEGTMLVTCLLVVVGMPLLLLVGIPSARRQALEQAGNPSADQSAGKNTQAATDTGPILDLGIAGCIQVALMFIIGIYAQAWPVEIVIFLLVVFLILNVGRRVWYDLRRLKDLLVWQPLKLASLGLLAVGLMLAGVVLVLGFGFNGDYPARSWKAPNQSDSGPEHPVVSTMDFIQAVQAQPPLNRVYSAGDIFNPFLWQYLLSVSYIVLGSGLLVGWLLDRQTVEQMDRHFRVFFVLLAYLAVGTAFAILYHNLYVSRIGMFNSELAHEFNSAATSIPLRLLPGSVSAARLRQQAKEVLTQDQPEIAVRPAFSGDPSPSFAATFQFQQDARFHSGEKLACAQVGLLGLSDVEPVRQNQDILDKFQLWFESQKAFAPPGDHDRGLSYEVQILAAANAVPYEADTDLKNESLARRRGYAVLKELRGVLTKLGSADPTLRENWFYRDLSARLGATVPQIVTQNELAESDPYADALCPKGTRLQGTDPNPVDLFRDARLTVFKVTANEPSALEMRLGLASNSTFMDMLYFSFVAFTTTGFGDIRPISLEARFYVIVENVLEVVFMSVFFTTAFLGRRGNHKKGKD